MKTAGVMLAATGFLLALIFATVSWRRSLGAPVLYVTSESDRFRHDRLAWETSE